ncbi:MAG: hypothetical protein Q4E24_11155, partial [bacterium]|nr:hypothetical protein [bacterium]
MGRKSTGRKVEKTEKSIRIKNRKETERKGCCWKMAQLFLYNRKLLQSFLLYKNPSGQDAHAAPRKM